MQHGVVICCFFYLFMKQLFMQKKTVFFRYSDDRLMQFATWRNHLFLVKLDMLCRL